ncbi:uncharacterized protein FIBRA_07969 [Fibroporia radiculosa]|uniref:IgA peptidase M64-domain-containing protein n=1 Tax=Fibroporia radiculosa TaxID=599839 RepID=J4I1T6_9APHY|nr:uncharacterized protein FIBRA_07969 [Fibroporia radiculosa]CCM05737.1 predicted protein [Fibroporia radiculosa]
MKTTLLTLATHLVGVALGSRGKQPFELLIHRDLETLRCTFISLHQTQTFRGLSDTGYAHVEPLDPTSEVLRFINHEPRQLREQIHSLCGDTIDPPANVPFILGDDVLLNTQLDNAQEVFASPQSSNGRMNAVAPPPLHVEPLITSGPSDNRVDLVFFADGYTLEEKGKFLADATRLALDMSGNQTFNTVKPLLNFWAAFTPSNESGVGTGGEPKDTPFGLYRDGTELRGVYYSKPEVARVACLSLGHRCDYPILMGNDPLYGGLGGEFTVITPSLANGALVLRHELGHSIIDVGEEYDGGPDYFGVNAAHSISQPIPWSHWLTNTSHSHHHKGVRVERSSMPMQAYPWTLLNVTDPWSIRFNSSGTYARHLVRFSLSGIPEKGDLLVTLDGEDLQWSPRPDIGVDRWHYDIHRDGGLGGGVHDVSFTLRNNGREGLAQLCSAEVLEFGNEEEFVSTPGYYGVFPTFSDVNATSYRPTSEDCLMRIVTSPNFCSVCLEGLWLSLLRRIDLIDDIKRTCVMGGTTSGHASGWKSAIEVGLVPLAQFRGDTIDAQESYTIIWRKDGEILEAFTNKTRVEVDDDVSLGVYTVDVQFATSEVRVDKDRLLVSNGTYEITETCSAW